MITFASRYTTSVAADGTVVAVRKPKYTEKYSVYTVREGDTLDLLATELYGDPSSYWRIADMNPHIVFPNAIHFGDVLRLPE